ncbi:MAG: sulfite oxidase-like oxidoreductase [Thaumarchaeota archaeon]|nr:sulfite oxidase-like oxidoreductase [Candidatus Calditenuaceae archaeon]MDW8041191.1 sulfite oxidase-like oxidoreductase [Nitrososphaerota archaeon]
MELLPRTLPPGQRYIKDFIVYAALGIPKVDLASYRLTVTGLVERPLSFNYEELMKLPMKKYVKDAHCVTRWSVKDVAWEGVQIKYLAGLAGVKPEASWVMFRCLDGYSTPVPIEDALDEDAIVALRMNGKPIPLENGFPARPFIPHLYLWKSAKWLTEIEFMDEYEDGFWERAENGGYHERGNVWAEERFKGMGGTHTRRRPVRPQWI